MQKLRAFCLEHHISAQWQVPMSDYTSLRIGGAADALIFPSTEEDLVDLLIFLKDGRIPFRLIGNATNLLVSDDGFRGAFISTRHIRSVFVTGTSVRAACGTPINTLCRTLADCSLRGLEALYGIPGTVGGAVFMNAGAFGASLSDRLSLVSAFNLKSGEITVIPKSDCGFSYRKSIFSKNREFVILSADFSFSQGSSLSIRERMREVLDARIKRHPTALPSAGSVFLRVNDQSAAIWIDRAGLRGARVGGAAVSMQHAGFIVNLGGATAADALALIKQVKDTVLERFGVVLQTEIEYITAE